MREPGVRGCQGGGGLKGAVTAQAEGGSSLTGHLPLQGSLSLGMPLFWGGQGGRAPPPPVQSLALCAARPSRGAEFLCKCMAGAGRT